MPDLEQLADSIFASVEAYIVKRLVDVEKRWDAERADLEMRLFQRTAIKGDKGEAGTNGKDADPEAMNAAIHFAVNTLRDSIVAEVTAAIPRPKDGDPGKDGVPGAKGADGINGKDGAPGADAEPIHPDTVSLMVAQEVTKAVALLPKAKDGDPGRDALAPDILDGLDETKVYARGTFAGHRGAFVKALRLTDPLAGKSLRDAGWQIIVDGDRDTEIVQESDLRTFTFRKTKASGLVIERKATLPVIIYRGIFKAGTEYQPGDTATWDGSTWHCERETKAEPGNGGDWKLMVKRGATGKDHNGAARG